MNDTHQASRDGYHGLVQILKVNDIQGAEGAPIMFKAGDIVEILPPFRDDGDEDFTWQVLADEEKNRVDICPIDVPLRIKPIYTLETSQVRLVGAMDPQFSRK